MAASTKVPIHKSDSSKASQKTIPATPSPVPSPPATPSLVPSSTVGEEDRLLLRSIRSLSYQRAGILRISHEYEKLAKEHAECAEKMRKEIASMDKLRALRASVIEPEVVQAALKDLRAKHVIASNPRGIRASHLKSKRHGV
jgi:hypothetical protein